MNSLGTVGGLLRPGVAALLLAIAASGCATTTAPVGSPDLSSELRSARHGSPDEALTRDARAQQLFLRGMTQARLGDHETALNLYARALELAPRTPAILAAAAESHELLGDQTTALQTMRQARDLAPDNPYYSLQLAGLYASTGDMRRAEDVYEDVLRASPHHVDALYELARVYTVNGDLARAVATYERILEEVGMDADVLNQMLHLYARMGDAEGMERTIGNMLEEAPHDAQLHRMLADVYLQQDRPEAALKELLDALEAAPGDAETTLRLAELYRRLGRGSDADSLLMHASSVRSDDPAHLLAQAAPLYERSGTDAEARATAEELLRRVLELDPTRHEGLVMLGNLRLDAGAYEEAAKLFHQALDTHPRDAQLWLHTASAYLQAGRLERAAAVADEGLLLFPGSVALMRVAGYALMEAYDNLEAIRRFESAVDLILDDRSEDTSGLSELYSALGLLYSRTGDFERSDEVYRQAIDANPSNAAALNNYAFSLADRGQDLEEALELAREAVAIEPDVPSYVDTLGWVLFKMGEHEAALVHLRRAADAPDASAAVFEHLGDVYDALDRPEAAREAWLRALELNPARDELQDKLGLE